MSTSTLYDQIGGERTIHDLVNRFYDRVLDDEELNHFFIGVPADRLRQMQHEFFSMALGGPVTYRGRPLADVHAGRGIDHRHLDRFVHHLLDTLREIDVPERALDAVIERLREHADDIAESPTSEPDGAR